MQIKGYDEWLWRQADEYMSRGELEEECEDHECGECEWCLNESQIAYDEARAEEREYEERTARYGH